jgi:hypothetical protein
VEVQRRGVPSIVVVSEVFVPLALAEAGAFGYDDLPMLVLPHPFGVLPRERVIEVAEAHAHEIARRCAAGLVGAEGPLP